MHIQAIHLYNLLEYAQIRGCTYGPLIEEAGNLPSDLLNEKAVVTENDSYKALGKINESLKDDHLGIHAGNFLSLKLLGLIYRISREVTAISEALTYLQSYLNASFPLILMQSSNSEDAFTVTLNILNNNLLNKIILENTLTIISRESPTFFQRYHKKITKGSSY